jgi:hypothetical protein
MLLVHFGIPEHFRIEFVNFVVVDFKGTYHAMTVPHNSYLFLKMPTEKGVLTIRGNIYTTYTCEEERFKVTEAIDLSTRMAETMSQAAQTPSDQLKAPKQQTSRKNVKSREHKEV